MEQLIADFNRSTVLQWYNPTFFHLDLQPQGGVITESRIPANTRIGELEGEPMYIWDMTHNDYIIVGDEFVLDISKQHPRSILNYVREENQSGNPNNCVVVTVCNHETGETRFFLDSIYNIEPGQELVYAVEGW